MLAFVMSRLSDLDFLCMMEAVGVVVKLFLTTMMSSIVVDVGLDSCSCTCKTTLYDFYVGVIPEAVDSVKLLLDFF